MEDPGFSLPNTQWGRGYTELAEDVGISIPLTEDYLTGPLPADLQAALNQNTMERESLEKSSEKLAAGFETANKADYITFASSGMIPKWIGKGKPPKFKEG